MVGFWEGMSVLGFMEGISVGDTVGLTVGGS